MFICLLILMLASFAYSRIRKNWQGPTTIAVSTTNLVSAVTGERIVLKHMLYTAKNAHYLYFYSGTAPSTTKISNDMYFAANESVNTTNGDPLDFITNTSEALGVWTSAAPATNMLFEVEKIKGVGN